MPSNRDSVFDEVVSLECWHTPFDDNGKSQLHVDATFRCGAVGKEADSPVRFEVSLLRAELSCCVPETENVAVIQSSVAREEIPIGEKTENVGGTAQAKAAAKASVSQTAMSAAGGVSGEAERHSSSETRLTSSIRPITSRQFRNSDGEHTWELANFQQGQPIMGKVWDPQSEPRLAFKKIRPSKLAPGLRVRVHCRRNDIHVDKIELKRKKNLKDRWYKNRMAAAEAAIKAILENRGLGSHDTSEKFAPIQLADVVVDEEIT